MAHARPTAHLLSAVLLVRAAAGSSESALARARLLVPPIASQKEKGEFEGLEFWEEHDELLTGAWKELGPRHRELYIVDDVFERLYIHPKLQEAVKTARAGKGEEAAWALFQEVVPGVYASQELFTPKFVEELLEELEHIESSGIPRRRPNGMNRFGAILDKVGLAALSKGLADRYFRPLGAMLFPELAGPTDLEEEYAFTIRYEGRGDTELAKHGDASVVTLNLCLGRQGWQGGEVRFFESGGTGIYALPLGNASAGAGNVSFQPGLGLLHRGQHKHQALPLLSGERSNMILWLMGRHGVVRAAPYPPSERLTPAERWAVPNRAAEL